MSNITNTRELITKSCMSKRVTIVLGETGTGKSTFVPLWISEASPNTRIVCAQPRRVAATSIAHRVSSLLGESSAGGTVGYKVRGEVVGCDGKTRIVYATAGYLRTALSCDMSLLEKYTHVILDEVHERSLDTDFLSLIVKLLLSEHFLNIHLVVMSATIDCTIFQEYFSPLCRAGETVSVVQIPQYENRSHRIETLYLEDLDPSVVGAVLNGLDKPFSDVREAACVDLACHLAISRAADGYTTLIFLPGEAEIMAVEKRLMGQYIHGHEFVVCENDEDFYQFDAQLAFRETVYYQIHILHSLVPSVEQRRALKAPVGVRGRHIVLATNIAESSLTVEAVNLVIDTGLKRESVWEGSKGGINTLKTKWTSRASLTQRRGRTGRVCSGTVIRLFTKSLESTFSEFDVPESALANPARVYLSAKFLAEKWNKNTTRWDPMELMKGLISSGVNYSEFQTTLDELFAQGVVLSAAPNAGLTLFGSLATWLQLDIPVAKIVYLCWLADLPVEGIVLAAACTTEKDPFKHASSKWKNEANFFYAVEASFRFRTLYDMGLASDVLMLRNLLVSWLSMRSRYSKKTEADQTSVYAVPFYANSVFPSEFQSFKNTCLLIARGMKDWLGFEEELTAPSLVTQSVVDSIFAKLEAGSSMDKKTVDKLSIFKAMLNDRKKCTVSHSDLSQMFLPMTDFMQADVLKLILAVCLGNQRALCANAAFARCAGDVFSMESDASVASRICGGIEPLEVRTKDKSVLVFAGPHLEENEALAVPAKSEYAAVSTCVAIRNVLCLFEKSWKIDLAAGDTVRKPFVFNICRWFLPATPLEVDDTRVYLNVRNPSGWLETRKNVEGSFRYGRSSLGNTFFCVPARLVTSGSLVRAEMNTILPIRAGGRVALTMLLAAIPFRGSSVRNRLVKNEERRECVEILNRLVTTRTEYPITANLVEYIDKFRELVAKALTGTMDKHTDFMKQISDELIKTISAMMDLANSEHVEPTISEPPTVPDTDTEITRVFDLRMDAIMAEVEMHWDTKREKLTLAQLDDACSAIWDMIWFEKIGAFALLAKSSRNNMYQRKQTTAPDPVIWKGEPLPMTAVSVASTTVTMSSPFKSSYAADLCDLGGTGELFLPPGSLDSNSFSSGCESGEEGSRYGKSAGRVVTRGYSIESIGSVDPITEEMFARLEIEADRMSRAMGSHIKVQKLTTSKTCPYKTLLRHPN